MSVSYQKKDGCGHGCPSFFRYDNDKDLKVFFLVTQVNCIWEWMSYSCPKWPEVLTLAQGNHVRWNRLAFWEAIITLEAQWGLTKSEQFRYSAHQHQPTSVLQSFATCAQNILCTDWNSTGNMGGRAGIITSFFCPMYFISNLLLTRHFNREKVPYIKSSCLTPDLSFTLLRYDSQGTSPSIVVRLHDQGPSTV